MAYCIYETLSTKFVRIMRNGQWCDAIYRTEAAAAGAYTKMQKAGKVHPMYHCIAELAHFHSNIEKTEERTGIGGSDGKKFVVPVNTPWTSGPWSETYWSS